VGNETDRDDTNDKPDSFLSPTITFLSIPNNGQRQLTVRAMSFYYGIITISQTTTACDDSVRSFPIWRNRPVGGAKGILDDERLGARYPRLIPPYR
jgi:hypothetical protein